MKQGYFYRLTGLILVSMLFTLCAGTRRSSSPQVKPTTPMAQDPFLENLLQQYPALFGPLLQKRDDYRLQIIYTQINRDLNNRPSFTDHHFNVDANRYFYPASTVKMPTALLALEKMRALEVPGLTLNSTMITEAAYSGQTEVYNDPTTPDGRPTLGHYVKKIFLVSDNDAFNRLYEFCGPEYINRRLHEMGYTSAEIIHRLERSLTEDENRHTNPVSFRDAMGKVLFQQPMLENKTPYQNRSEKLGQAYYKGGQLMEGPMDFSRKNRLVLTDLHDILKSILFPEAMPLGKRFRITDEDYRFVRKYMSQYPAETTFPAYDTTEHWDAYCKFLYWGTEKGPLPKSFRIFNKVGDAYGFLIDAAYVVDFEQRIEFMVSATIYCNKDGVLNDSQYDYDEIGYPFLKNLGRVIYEHEKKRQRPRWPDLSTFRIQYEK